jgi:hypothetical protein
MNPKLTAWIAGVVLVFTSGLGLGWKLWGTKPTKVETYAPPVVQQDGSVVLERKPQADAKPAQQIPKGGKVERVVQVVVQPTQQVPSLPPSGVPSVPSASGASLEPARPPCPPVRVDLTLVRMPDDSRRVVASSPDGKVVGGVDIPVTPSVPPRPLLWAAGGLYSVKDRGVGVWLDRDLAFARVGGEIIRTPATSTGLPAQWTGSVRLGLRF